MERFIVAANTLVDAYGDVTVRGHFSEPGLAAAAFVEMKTLLGYLASAGLDAIPYTGADMNELIRMEKEFHGHNCSCVFCFGGVSESERNGEGE